MDAEENTGKITEKKDKVHIEASLNPTNKASRVNLDNFVMERVPIN